ncbi:hypothetical protein AVEN_23520-1 [Araneus ventricosus]|uniref:Uncharacterized protein n=1 Tax=Araneus ventricosus TaxID=182803 RepID=A0A4Y2UNB0_ARAVE|nr:hypothetical protein AVEN_23520-1 [Araneus ventricosus]
MFGWKRILSHPQSFSNCIVRRTPFRSQSFSSCKFRKNSFHPIFQQLYSSEKTLFILFSVELLSVNCKGSERTPFHPSLSYCSKVRRTPFHLIFSDTFICSEAPFIQSFQQLYRVEKNSLSSSH